MICGNPNELGGVSSGGTSGGWDGSEPGQVSTVGARAIEGGIEASWEYPSVSPYAVAHFMVFRGTSQTFSEAALRGIISANRFVDRIESQTEAEYYYWVKVVSLSGNVQSEVGPGYAVYRPAAGFELGEVGIAGLTQQVRDLLGSIAPLKQAVEADLLSQNQAIDFLADSVSTLETSVATQIAAIEATVANATAGSLDFTQMANDLAALVNTTKAELEAAVGVLESDLTTVADRVTATETANTTQDERLGALETAVSELQASTDGSIRVVGMTQAEYDALSAPDAMTLYVIRSA